LKRKWGRVGTEYGSHTKKEYSSKAKAIDAFRSVFEDKTGDTCQFQNFDSSQGNPWENRSKDFEKKPGKYVVIEIDYGGSDALKNLKLKGGNSKLDRRLQV
jgi:hypothetical protein